MKKDVTICFRTSELLRQSLEKIAGAERRSLSSIIENILYGYVKSRPGPKGTGRERRDYSRKEVSFPALVYREDTRESTLQTGIVNDISLGGMRISIPHDYPVENNREFNTVFTIPGEKAPIRMRCNIKRIANEAGNVRECGAAFVDGDFAGYQKLQKYLS